MASLHDLLRSLTVTVPRETIVIPSGPPTSAPPTGDNVFNNPEDLEDWCRERGLESSIRAHKAHKPEPVIFHNPRYADGSEGSYILGHSTRQFVPDPVPIPPSHIPKGKTYEIRTSGDTGNGMFATRDIAPGETILAEHPTLLQSRAMSFPTYMNKEEMYKTMYSRLEPDVLARLRTLKNCKPPDVCGWEEGIIRTNSIGVILPNPVFDRGWCSAVFIDVSRCNHSCGANADHDWDIGSLSLKLFASRPIKAGDEITISYVPQLAPRAERRRSLSLMYYFDCACACCDLPGDAAIALSDERRAFLKAWTGPGQAAIQSWFCTPSMPAAAVLAPYLKANEYIEAEGLHATGIHRGIVDAVAGIYGMSGNREKFAVWCRKAIDVWAVAAVVATFEEVPEGIGKVKKYKKWLAQPSSFKAWNKRPEAPVN